MNSTTKDTSMQLTKVHINEFKSIRDSNEFTVGDITCLVGKNEAGKTALLQALYRLNPILPDDGKYSITDDYPRWDVQDYQIEVETGTRKHASVVEAVFTLDDSDVSAVEKVFGTNALSEKLLTVWKGYQNGLRFSLKVDEAAILQHLVDEGGFTPEAQSALEACDTIDKIPSALKSLEQTQSVTNLTKLVTEIINNKGISTYIFNKILWPRAPKFLYFDEYYQMEGHTQIEGLKTRKEQKRLLPPDYPLLGLINLARLDLEMMLNPERTRDLKNALEGAGNHLTKQIVKYWSQNRYLELRFDVRPGCKSDPEGMTSGTNIWGEVFDSKHRVTTEIGTRSRGFVWFFSFLAWYGDVQRNEENVILLLDEPGLSLHAKAQEDLLRYFDAEVKHQLIYTTHSPFMVDPSHFDRIRIVQDLSIETDESLPKQKEGTKVISDVLEATEDSLFPLQGALGYEIYQTLFIGPNSLVVEGVSDLLYLQSLSALLESRERTGLDRRWTITPVGGSDKVPTFVSLIGAQKKLNVAVLIDYQKKDSQNIENLFKRKLLEKKKVMTFADFVAGDEADIEDMFDTAFYLHLVTEAYTKDLHNPTEILALNPDHARITVQIQNYFDTHPLNGNATWNHYRPARFLVDNMSAFEQEISEETLNRFESVYKRLNGLL